MVELITPERLKSLPPYGRFYFGSNESGYHGAGAAFDAWKRFGARYKKGFGPNGRSFAIPTKDWDVQTLPLPVIDHYVQRAIEFIKANPEEVHIITRIGCGLAGYEPKDIAPMFVEVADFANVWLPEDFRIILKKLKNTYEGL